MPPPSSSAPPPSGRSDAPVRCRQFVPTTAVGGRSLPAATPGGRPPVGPPPRPPAWRRDPPADDHGVVPAALGLVAVEPVPTGVGYSVLLLLHVGCAVIGFGALATTGVQARRAGKGGAPAESVRRYFRPGVNWAARTLYGVPVFGFALIGASGGSFHAGDGFVVAGLGLWALAAAVAEAVVWPAERRIQVALSEVEPADDRRFEHDCRRVATAAALLSVVFVTAVVLMVARP
jgi:hypothetical protein